MLILSSSDLKFIFKQDFQFLKVFELLYSRHQQKKQLTQSEEKNRATNSLKKFKENVPNLSFLFVGNQALKEPDISIGCIKHRGIYSTLMV